MKGPRVNRLRNCPFRTLKVLLVIFFTYNNDNHDSVLNHFNYLPALVNATFAAETCINTAKPLILFAFAFFTKPSRPPRPTCQTLDTYI